MAAAQAPCDSSTLPAHDVKRLDYTRRDWARWDSFDLDAYSLVRRRQHSLGLDASQLMTSPAENFHALFREQIVNEFFGECYRRFRRLQTHAGSCDDFIAHLAREHNLLVEPTLQRVCFALNQEYNHWREAQRLKARAEITAAAARQTSNSSTPLPIDIAALDAQVDLVIDSTPFDFRTHPQCAPTIAWISALLELHLSQQCQDDSSTTNASGKSWKNFGLWSEKDGSFQQGSVYWRSPGIGFIHGHFLHLLSDDLIRKLRCATFTSLSAQFAFHSLSGMNYPHHLESQWLLRVAGFVQAAFVLLRSETELKSRKTWRDDSDAVDAADRTTGRWTNADLISFTEELSAEFCGRIGRVGQTEFLSSYTGYIQDLLGAILLHAPSQRIYDSFTSVMDRLIWDLVANLLPGCGTFPGPSSRSYDLFAGAHNTQDRLDYHFFKHAFQPHCNKEEIACRTHSNGVVAKQALCLVPLMQQACPAMSGGGPPVLVAPSGNLDQNIHRSMYSHTQLAGHEPTPFEFIRSLQLSAPGRLVEQRFSHVSGQERSNFLTRDFQIGFAGEDVASVATAVFVCARLSGAPVAGAPVALVNHGDTHCTSMLRLYPQIGSMDDPFHRDHRLDVAGKDRMVLGRQVATQYQGWMLVTSLLAPQCQMKDEEVNGSWNSHLVLPINCDAIYADDVQLPTQPGSFFRIPPNAILTVRHLGVSIAVRLASFTHDEDVPHADRVEPSSEAPRAGRQPCSVTWHVDDSSVLAGCGRITVHHRHALSTRDASASVAPPLKPYRVAWLWGCGVTKDDIEMTSLAAVLRSAEVREAISGKNWNEFDQPRNTYSSREEVGEQLWSLDVLVADALNLSVHRTDVYQPFNHHEIYSLPRSGPLHRPPYFFRQVARRVNDTETLTWQEGEDPYRFTPVAAHELFEPHRAGGCTHVFTDRTPTHFAPLATAD